MEAKTTPAKILEADHRAQAYLGDYNEAEERGQYKKAEKIYAKAQYWLDRLNKLQGNS